MRKTLEKQPALVISLATIAAYISGFIFWNKHLSSFGFFEYNNFQVRYLSAGLLFLVPIAVLFLISKLVIASKSEQHHLCRCCKFFMLFVLLLSGIVWTLCFLEYFRKIPQHFGGGRPMPTTLIGSEQQIKYLSENFSLKAFENGGDNLPVQTEPVCIMYQNNDYVILGYVTSPSQGHIISIRRDQFLGYRVASTGRTEENCVTLSDQLSQRK